MSKSEWIEWNGGECPVDPWQVEVEVKLRDGSQNSFYGYGYDWSHRARPRDIIAYRVVKPEGGQ